MAKSKKKEISKIEIILFAVEVRKWDSEAKKISMEAYFVVDDREDSLSFDIGMLQPTEMVEEITGKLRHEWRKKRGKNAGEDTLQIEFNNESFVRQKLHNYFKRINSELSGSRRKKGQARMILTTHMDIYNETQDISFLPKKLQFFVVLNWARKYYLREDYKKAIDPLRRAVKLNGKYAPAIEMLARALKKVRKYDEAMRMYERYAEVDGGLAARLDLAKSYRKGKLFEKSEKLYQLVLAEQPKNREAQIGLAQIQYANMNPDYMVVLESLSKSDPGWLKKWLAEEFNFRIYVSTKTLLTPVQAAKLLGFSQIFELTQRAFKNELPSHFNASRARLSFYLEELENWAKVMNRFKILPEKIKLYPDKIKDGSPMEAVAETPAAETPPQEGSTSKVEEMLRQIRARKAQRIAQQVNSAKASSHPGKNGKPASRKKTTRQAPKADH